LIHHEGEQAVQRRAGEGSEGWGSPMFGAEIPVGFHGFLLAQRMVVLGARDEDGALWATVLAGPRRFVTPTSDRTIEIAALPAHGDPLRDAFATPRDAGMLAIEPESRRRIRVNGRVTREGDGLHLTTDQVLGNCPKYITTRKVVGFEPQPGESEAEVRHGDVLTADQQELIRAADTFFIASHGPGQGGDASHRGGMPGFVRILGSGRRLAWPDYFGNSFYMTLGNMELDPRCGLLFVDWGTGDTLQLTGRGRIDWDPRHAAEVSGALRLVEFDVERVVQVRRAHQLRWELVGYSRYNPPSGVADDVGPPS
jgi:predicted pyridoxine 5'-phosphate oxidase superfamily flavin-nucleotide-binding protein